MEEEDPLRLWNSVESLYQPTMSSLSVHGTVDSSNSLYHKGETKPFVTRIFQEDDGSYQSARNQAMLPPLSERLKNEFVDASSFEIPPTLHSSSSSAPFKLKERKGTKMRVASREATSMDATPLKPIAYKIRNPDPSFDMSTSSKIYSNTSF